ncbi:MAG TPA: hemerythrin domain-containing protein [Devosia sp.]|nr:hemerythrin domain-containing protein [Devosia sp.]
MILDIAFLDDATRPTAPKLTGLTPRQKAGGDHLRQIHDHLRDNMKVLRRLIERASAGEVKRADVDAATADMEMIANYRRFGNLCGQYCSTVNTHHSIEDYALWPALAAKSEAYRKVTDRLVAEHVVVHELLERLIDAINDLSDRPTHATFEVARELYETMEKVLNSHLGYEEDEICDPLGYYGIL